MMISATPTSTRGARATDVTTHRCDAFVRVMRRDLASRARASATRAAMPTSSSRRYRHSRGARRHRPSTRVDALGPIPETTFAISTACVMPLYALMIAKPRSTRVAAVMESKGTFWILGACYLCVGVRVLHERGRVRFGATNACRRWGRRDGGAIRHAGERIHGDGGDGGSAWVHLVALDLFVARFVYLDGAKYSASAGDLVAPVPVRHSLVLCCMFGPLGLMSHAITRWFWNTFVVVDVV